MDATQCRMARAGLSLSVDDLAKLAGLSNRSVIRFENGERLKPESVQAIADALIAAGASFVEHGGKVGAVVKQ